MILKLHGLRGVVGCLQLKMKRWWHASQSGRDLGTNKIINSKGVGEELVD